MPIRTESGPLATITAASTEPDPPPAEPHLTPGESDEAPPATARLTVATTAPVPPPPRATLHRIVSKETFDFTSLEGSRNFSAPLVRALDVSEARDIQIVARVHSFEFTGDAAIEVIVEAVSLTEEEPETDFVGPVVASARLTNSSGPAPVLLLGGLTTPVFGHMVRVRLVATKPPGATVVATLSIDLAVRDY
jgi:hypothetical protein